MRSARPAMALLLLTVASASADGQLLPDDRALTPPPERFVTSPLQPTAGQASKSPGPGSRGEQDGTASEGRPPLLTLLASGPVGVTAPAPVPARPRERRGPDSPEGWLLGGGERARSLRQPPLQRSPWWAPLLSAVVPGGGQAILGQDRAVAYAAVEAYGWLRYISDVREARSQRDGYRALAARVARANLSDSRPPGDFEYYERMEHFVESGVFDASGAEGVQPETDPVTYNGFIWQRARTTFWEDPTVPPPAGSDAYMAALDYYASRAIMPEFRWSWRNAQLEQDVFRRTISRSNEAFRRSIQDLGVIIANHALSTVDAYVSLRLRRIHAGPAGVGLEASVPWSPGRLPW